MIRAFNKPFSFVGRIGRLDFIYVVVSVIFLAIFLRIVTMSFHNIGFIFFAILCLPVLCFLLAQGTKRLHDINLSGWVQIVYPIAFFLMLFKASDPNDNQYGESVVTNSEAKQEKSTVQESILSQKITDAKKENPSSCPQCKSPNNAYLNTCEWCGYQF